MQSITRRRLYILFSAVSWVIAWYVVSLIVGEELFLPSPIRVVSRLFNLMGSVEFYKAILFSLSRVVMGFLLATTLALLLSSLSYASSLIEIALSPIVSVIKSTPVASIIILVLVWVKSRNLSIIISSLMVFPVIYINVLEGLKSTPKDIIEMASSYRVKRLRRIRYIYIPYVMPYFVSGVKSALGFGFKSAIAAEVIGLPFGSIGENLYMSKVYLDTPSLFAWTLVIIILSFAFERFFLFMVRLLERRLSR